MSDELKGLVDKGSTLVECADCGKDLFTIWDVGIDNGIRHAQAVCPYCLGSSVVVEYKDGSRLGVVDGIEYIDFGETEDIRGKDVDIILPIKEQ